MRGAQCVPSRHDATRQHDRSRTSSQARDSPQARNALSHCISFKFLGAGKPKGLQQQRHKMAAYHENAEPEPLECGE